MMGPAAGRRLSDVDPAVELFVKDELRETRHALRADIAELGTKVATGQMLATEEHAKVNAKLDQLQTAVAALQPLVQKVADLETSDAVDHASATATEKLLTRQRQQFYALAGLIVTAAGVIAALGR